MTRTAKKPSFVRLFIGGFVIGAAGLVAVQAAQADVADLPPAAASIVGVFKG